MDHCPSARQIEQLSLGELAPETAGTLEAHLSNCAECRATCERLREEQIQTRLILLAPRQAVPRASDRHPTPRRAAWSGPKTPQPVDEGSNPTHQTRADPDRHTADAGSTPEDLRQLAHYRIVRLIGRGGMGVVYWAEDTHLQRPVAIKVLRQSSAQNIDVRQRFLREARAMAALKHDHIAVIYQVSESATDNSEGQPFLAMELLDGENLDTWMKGNPHPPIAWLTRIGREAAEGLTAAHTCGLLHRDIKPANLWLEAPPGWMQTPAAARPPLGAVGRIKLLDFGLALPSMSNQEEDEEIVGTPAYMAPEQARGEPLDARCDLFALGCVLYQISTGRHPFPRRHRGDPATWPPHQPPAPVRDLNPAIPARLAGLIERLIAEKPNDRPDSARQVAQELAALERAARGPHHEPGLDTETWPPLPRPNVQRKRALVLATLALLFLAAGGVAAWWAWPHPAAAEPQAEVPPATHPETTPKPPRPVDPLSVPGPPDAAWCRRVGELPPASQAAAVLAKLVELNPGFDGQALRSVIEEGRDKRLFIKSLSFPTDAVTDIRPIQALTQLKSLACTGSRPGAGRLTDLSPLKGMELDWLFLWNNPGLSDFRPLAEMKLIQFEASHTPLNDLGWLNAERLRLLNVRYTQLCDLRAVRHMPWLGGLYFDGCDINSIEALRGKSLDQVILDYRPERDYEILRSISTLKQINRMPAKDFWRQNLRPEPVEIPDPS